MDDFSFGDLPDEPELAFLELETRFRAEFERAIEEENGTIPVYLRYMSRVLAARSELSLPMLDGWKVPSADNYNSSLFQNFIVEVEHYKTAIQIRYARRAKAYSVRLSAADKEKIRHFVSQIREIIDTLPPNDHKKGRLFARLNAFQEEVDQDRTRLETYGALAISVAGIIGEAAEKMEPARKWLDSIAKVMWNAKEQEQPRLPAPESPKRIEPPQRAAETQKPDELDDEIPF